MKDSTMILNNCVIYFLENTFIDYHLGCKNVCNYFNEEIFTIIGRLRLRKGILYRYQLTNIQQIGAMKFWTRLKLHILTLPIAAVPHKYNL